MNAQRLYDAVEYGDRPRLLRPSLLTRSLQLELKLKCGAESQARVVKTGWLGFLAALLCLVGCATPTGQYTLLANRYPPKPANYSIEVFTNSVPTRTFERVAVLDAHCESQFWATPSLEADAIPELKRQARAAGCDAIIEIELRKPSNWTLETRTIHVTANGIVYR